MLLVIEGDPIPWKAHKGSGRKSFNPLYKEREMVKWMISKQLHDNVKKILGPVEINYIFYFKIPKSFSKLKQKQALSRQIFPEVRPDLTNLVKFYEDCLKDFVIEDDSKVVKFTASKVYANMPETLITISPFELGKD